MANDGTSTSVFKRLLKRPSSIVALVIISVTSLVALFAYMLAPDNTPAGNTLIVELSARPPGFTIQLLHIPNQQSTQPPAFTRWFYGTPANYKVVPVNSYSFNGNQLGVNHYIDEGIQDTIVYPFQQLLPAELKNAPTSNQEAFIAHLIQPRTFYLGTDRYGRDILSRLLIGSRVSLSVGFVAVILSLTIGILLGCLAGYYGGVIDNMVMWVINILWAMPTLLLVFAITLTIGKGFWEIFVAIGLTMWVSTARLIRGQVLVLKEMEYITAAKALGLGDMRIIFRHILPNIAGPIMVIAASNFAAAILIEAGLSFLGIGVQPPNPSWGLMIKEHYSFLLTNRPLLALIPGIAIMLLVYAFNILGNGLRDALDTRS